MAIRWRCPDCGGDSIFGEGQPGPTVECSHCRSEVQRRDALCILCESPDGVHPRDSIHVQCASCGETQMVWRS